MSILKQVIDSLFRSTKEYVPKGGSEKPPLIKEMAVDKARKEEGTRLEKELLKSKTEENRNPLENLVSKEEVHFKAHAEEENHLKKEVEGVVGAYAQHNIINPNEEDESSQAYLTHNHQKNEGRYHSAKSQNDIYNQH